MGGMQGMQGMGGMQGMQGMGGMQGMQGNQQMNPFANQGNSQMMGNNAGMMGNSQNMQNMQQQMLQQQMQQMAAAQTMAAAQQQMMQQQMMQNQMAFMQQQNMMAQQQAMRQAQINNLLNNQGNNAQSPVVPTATQPQSAQQPMGQSQGFSVIFRASGATGQAGAPIMVQCTPNDKVSEVIDRYRNKANDHDDTKKFIFNAKNLNTSLSVAEAGITNNANIFVVATKGIKGAN